jgi:outer membrane protein assembly factor BamB
MILLACLAWSPAAPAAQDAPDAKTLLWTVETKSPSYGSAAAADLDGDGVPEIVFGTYYGDEQLYCVDGKTGAVKWRKQSRGGPLDASVLIADVDSDGAPEIVFGDSAHGTIWCLDAAGAEQWVFDGPSGTDSPPAAADLDGDGTIEIVYGTMKVKGGAGRVVTLDGATGAPRWSAEVPGHVQSEPALVDLDADGVRDVLVTNWMGDGKLRALNGKDGIELWSFVTGDWIYHGVSVNDFDGDGKPEIVVADRKGSVWMLEGESGAVQWTAALEGEREGSVFGPTTLVDADGKGAPEIVVCGAHLHLLDARKGETRWRRAFGGASLARGTAAADVDGDGRQDLVFGEGTRLRAARARDGKELWAWELRGGEDVHEGLDHAPLILDLDGDGRLDVFIVGGKGTSGATRASNYGRAWALRAGKGKAAPEHVWTTFRGSNLRGGR